MGLLDSLASGHRLGIQEIGTAAIALTVLYAVYCVSKSPVLKCQIEK